MLGSKYRTRFTLVQFTIITVLLWSSLSLGCVSPQESTLSREKEIVMKLPEPRYDGNISVEQAILQRRSVRAYTDEPLSLDEVSQLLWAAQGITDPNGFRTAPSAGGTYPLNVYLVTGNTTDLGAGIYRYEPSGHVLERVVAGDMRAELASAALGQDCVRDGAINIVLTGIYERTTERYGERGIRYVHMEAGHAAQNVYLQAAALNLGTVVVGAFHDDQVREILGIDKKEHPLYIIPVGKK